MLAPSPSQNAQGVGLIIISYPLPSCECGVCITVDLHVGCALPLGWAFGKPFPRRLQPPQSLLPRTKSAAGSSLPPGGRRGLSPRASQVPILGILLYKLAQIHNNVL